MNEEEVFLNIRASITDVLIAAQNAQDKEASDIATKQYQQWERDYFPMWMTALAYELADDTKTLTASRQIAGLAFRRNLDADTQETLTVVSERWKQITTVIRDHIKAKVMGIMGSEDSMIRSLAAQCIGQIAVIEIEEWLAVVDILSDVVLDQDKSDYFKESALIALETICRSVSPELLEENAPKILSAIAQGMISPHYELQVVATKSLSSALNFSSKNFSRARDRQDLMLLILNATKSFNESVRLAAFECLVQVVEPYYAYIGDYMNDIFGNTLNAIKTDEVESIVLQAIEFWTTLSEHEAVIIEENQAREDQISKLLPLYNFIAGAAPMLCEPICACIVRDIESDLGQWTITSAASSCLSAMAMVVGKEIIPLVSPFVAENIASEQLDKRASALLAFGAIMEGPDTQDLSDMIIQALPVIFYTMSINVHYLRINALWLLCRIAQYHAPALEAKEQLEPYLHTLCMMLSAEPAYASFACEAIDKLASAIPESSPDNPLNPYFANIFESLMRTVDRPDSHQENLLLCALEAIRTLIYIVPDDMLNLVEHMVSQFGIYLSQTIQSTSTPQLSDIQGELCGILSTCASRLGSRIGPVAPDMVNIFFNLIQNNPSSFIHQECFMSISSLIRAIETKFEPFMPTYTELLFRSLTAWQDPDLCRQAVFGVTDLCLYLPTFIKPHCEQILNIFIQNLQQPDISSSLAPDIVACLSDLANAMGPDFAVHLTDIMGVFDHAAELAVVKTHNIVDVETIDRINAWRETILAAYSLTILGLQKQHKQQLSEYMPRVFYVVKEILNDQGRRRDIINRGIAGLLSDIAIAFGNAYIEHLRPYINFLHQTIRSTMSSPETIEVAEFALKNISNL